MKLLKSCQIAIKGCKLEKKIEKQVRRVSCLKAISIAGGIIDEHIFCFCIPIGDNKFPANT